MPDLSNWLIVIPARLGSTRIHQKPLQILNGKPLIVQVYKNIAGLIRWGAKVVVATDSQSIFSVCEDYQIEVVMTSADHQSGTDRCYEVATQKECQYVMNVQGDEPFFNTDDLINLCEKIEKNTQADIATLVFVNSNETDFSNPNIVKVVMDQRGFAIYFSRSSIPYHRDSPFQSFLHHQGVYAFRKSALQKFCALPQSPLEQKEKLEQLRAINHGMNILLVPTAHKSFGIDTPHDLTLAESMFS